MLDRYTILKIYYKKQGEEQIQNKFKFLTLYWVTVLQRELKKLLADDL